MIVSVDGAYGNRNNSTDHRVVTIVEQSTSYKFLLHIAMKYASNNCILQQLEQKLIKERLSYISETCGFNILTVAHNEKEMTLEDLYTACGDGTQQARDPWHTQKNIQADYQAQTMAETKCIMGNKQKKILANTTEIKKAKMKLRNDIIIIIIYLYI